MSKLKPPNQRSASILIAVLVCMGVATAILFTAVHVSSGHRRQIRQELQMEQTKWLVDAGVRKAIAEIEIDEDYSGEAFSLAPLLKYDKANLEINVTPNEKEPSVLVAVSASVNRGEHETTETKRTSKLKIAQ